LPQQYQLLIHGVDALRIYNSEDSDEAKFDALEKIFGPALKGELNDLTPEENAYIYGIAGPLAQVSWVRVHYPWGKKDK
jgi:hypothetical protein